MKKIAILLLLLVISACTTIQPSVKPGVKPDQKQDLEPNELKKFTSRQQILDFLEKSGSSQDYGFGEIRSLGMEVMEMDVGSGALAAPTSKMDSAEDFSTTNIQVEGVDEADFVKNDGKYIYIITGNKLVIVDAYPAEDAEILSETKIEGTARDLFINEDKLVLFTQTYEPVHVFSEFDFMPRPIHKQKTHVYIYDIRDREDPDLEKDYDVKGNYYDARMIGNYVYVIVQDPVYYYQRYLDMPVVMESSSVRVRPDIYYFDIPERNFNFNTIVAVNLNDNSVNAESYMMGYANTLYVSQHNIYIAHRKDIPYYRGQVYTQDRFYDVVVPLLPSYTKSEINKIKTNDLDPYEKWDQISAVLEEMYNEMEENEKEDLIMDIEDAIIEYEINRELERRKTIIHKISIDKDELNYDGKGEVRGYLLNQFSMDEDGEYFRVATTVEGWTRGESILYNNVYILDDDLDVVGELEDIAPDERIYSTRFIGDRLYMVTFKRVDPFFVIDLSNPKNPEILGKLKIPGFSDYLHPYDENHIIGIGKETTANEWGGVTTEGVKLALFDVSDVENPKQIDKYEIGEKGSDSEALRDHKAFLFDKEKNLLVLPVREVKGRFKYNYYYRYRTWHGAYVFSLTPEDGFEVQGKITHNENENDELYYRSNNAVRRSLYMDDVLYTISMEKLMMHDLDGIEEINEIELPYQRYDYGYIEPRSDIAIE